MDPKIRRGREPRQWSSLTTKWSKERERESERERERERERVKNNTKV